VRVWAPWLYVLLECLARYYCENDPILQIGFPPTERTRANQTAVIGPTNRRH